mgnify:CR=1 FL=1
MAYGKIKADAIIYDNGGSDVEKTIASLASAASTASPTFTGDVTLTGAANNVVFDASDNALEFADNAKARFGASNDLEIYHDGSNSYIDEGGTGKLLLESNSEIQLQISGGAETTARFINNGAVELYHDNTKKFETTAAGVTVTGSVTDSKGNVRSIPQNTQGSSYTLVAADAGKHILAGGNITWSDSVHAAGDAITIVNNTSGNITITKGTTMYNAADGTNANRTLAARGIATILWTSATASYISGAGLT